MAIKIFPYTAPIFFANRVARVPLRGYRLEEGEPNDGLQPYEPQEGADQGSVGTSRMGLPLFSRLKINAIDYDDYDRKGNLLRYSTDEMVFEDAIMSVRHVTNRVRTVVAGGREVTQHTGRGATRVSVKAFIQNDPLGNDARKWPYEKIAAMKAIADAPVAFPVDSLFLRPHGVSEAWIDNVHFPENEFTNVQTVTFELVEDVRIDLQPELN